MLSIIILCGILMIIIYIFYWIFFVPLNWTRSLTEISYNFAINGKNDKQKRDTINHIRKLRKITNDNEIIPPPYPNGWYAITESINVPIGKSIYVTCLGEQFVVFRSEQNEVYSLNAYCPHLGANLGINGTVIGDSIECPFHNWRFNGKNGNCINIPYSSCIPKSAKVKSWLCKEANDFIFIWYHAENNMTPWKLPIIKEIQSNQILYHGRNEFIVNSHIQDIPENGSDLAHFNCVHGLNVIAGSQPKYKWRALFGKHNWNASWCTSNKALMQHTSIISLQHSLKIFSKLDICTLNVQGHQMGPGYVHLSTETSLGPIFIIQSVVPIEPLVQKVIHRFYSTRLNAAFMKFFIYAESIMFERDVDIFNHKLYTNNPCLVKEDRTIKLYRNWFSQFYSENSKTFETAKNSLNW